MPLKRFCTGMVALLTLVLVGPAASALMVTTRTIRVTTARDVVRNDGRCSLREAITATASASPSGTRRGECPPGDPPGNDEDVIVLKPHTTYRLTIGGVDEDNNANGDLDVTTHNIVHIDGKPGTVIKQTTRSRVLDVQAGAVVTATRITFTGGHPPDGEPSGTLAGSSGGGIRVAGALTLTRSRVVRNRAGDGVASASTAAGGNGGDGGGIENSGTLFLQSSTVSRNAAGNGADAAASVLNVSGPGNGGRGGGIHDTHGVSLYRSSVTHNAAGRGGAGLSVVLSAFNGGNGGDGGGVDTGAGISLNQATISSNAAGAGGAGGTGSAGLNPGSGTNGGNGGRGGGLFADGALTSSNSTVARNGSGSGGKGGTGGQGTTLGGGGGAGGDGGDGGGIWVSGAATIRATTVARNATSVGGGGGAGGTGPTPGGVGANGLPGDGGGLFEQNGPGGMINSTIDGNRARGNGGGIDVGDNFVLNNATVAHNAAGGAGGGLAEFGGAFTLANSIVGNNSAPTGPDCSGAYTSDGYNLIRSVVGCTGLSTSTDINGRDPRLARLGHNGGPTETDALKRRSPAIDHGNPAPPGAAFPACAAADQRGVKRVHCDIGAYERKPS